MKKDLYNKYKELILYVIVGGLTTVVSVASYALFTRVFNFGIYSSSILSWILAVTFAFIANKKVVFKSNNNVKKEVISFFILRLVSLGADLATMWILCDLLNINDLIAKIIVQFIVTASNYVFSKFLIFRR